MWDPKTGGGADLCGSSVEGHQPCPSSAGTERAAPRTVPGFPAKPRPVPTARLCSACGLCPTEREGFQPGPRTPGGLGAGLWALGFHSPFPQDLVQGPRVLLQLRTGGSGGALHSVTKPPIPDSRHRRVTECGLASDSRLDWGLRAGIGRSRRTVTSVGAGLGTPQQPLPAVPARG